MVPGVNFEVRPETMARMRKAVAFWAKCGQQPKLSRIQAAIWQEAAKL